MSSLILASSSIYRRAILEQMNLTFQCISPEIDESMLHQETVEALVARLALEKAKKIAREHQNSLIIGSDQSAIVGSTVLSKPLTAEKAMQQLALCSGKKVTFLTSICLYDSRDNTYQSDIAPYHVYFRELTDAEISRYIAIEQPLQCAGSFKVEGLGISLFEKLAGDDFNSLIGLPIIKLLAMLRNKGISPLS